MRLGDTGTAVRWRLRAPAQVAARLIMTVAELKVSVRTDCGLSLCGLAGEGLPNTATLRLISKPTKKNHTATLRLRH